MNSQPIAMFCTYCIQTGQPKKMCNSHFLRESRDKDSAIVCPVLKATVCYFCGETGHIPSYCTALKETVCTQCGKTGHNAKYCQRLAAKQQTPAPQVTNDGWNIVTENGKTNAVNPKLEIDISSIDMEEQIREFRKIEEANKRKQIPIESIDVRQLEAQLTNVKTWASIVETPMEQPVSIPEISKPSMKKINVAHLFFST